MSKWTWVGASRQGTSHLLNSQRIQDAFQCTVINPTNDFFFAVVADGAGSASMGGEGASLLSRAMINKAREYMRETESMPNDTVIHSWIEFARDQITVAAANRGLNNRDFATTLVCAMSTALETVVVHIGDGCAVIKNAETSIWEAASWPSQGEYASTTYFVTDQPEPATRIARYQSPISALALLTDGLERLALNFATKEPHQAFFNGISKAVFASSATGRDAKLSEMLGSFLDSAAVNARTNDDKTIVIAVNQ